MTRHLFDMSSYIKTAMLVGTDKEHGVEVEWEGERIIVPSAEYGYENVINMMVAALNDSGLAPHNAVLVFEGMHAKSKRLLIDKNYKAKRDKRPPEFYEEFGRLKDYLKDVWLGMGAVVCWQDHVEADDVIAWLARESEEDLIIDSRDNDLGSLNTEEGQTNGYGAQIRTRIDGLIGGVKLKGELFVHPYRFVTLFKALVGDDSDSIPGVKGFGPAKFAKLVDTYGYDGLDELMTQLERGDSGPLMPLLDEKGHKEVKMILGAWDDAVRCYRLAKLHPEWINTFQHPVQWLAGKVSPLQADTDERLRHWYGQSKLVTADNYDEAYTFIREEMEHTVNPAFDIETSTGDESDEWLEALKDPNGVDTLGSTLTGFSMTFGHNMQYTVYVSVDHADTNNVPMSKARKLIELMSHCPATTVHNNFFELPVLYGQQDEDESWWRNHWRNNGYHGFLPNCLDTKLEASYVDENRKLGLKERSLQDLRYQQQTFAEVTLIDGVQHKMNELSAAHVFHYGCDDTICTAALHNYYKLRMQLEHTWQVYLDVEIDAAYQHAKNYIDGMNFSLERMNELVKEDQEVFDKAWATVRQYLIDHQWEGTVPPTYTPDITVKQIKEAYAITEGVCSVQDGEEEESEPASEEGEESAEELDDSAGGEEPGQPETVAKDPVLSTRIRTPSRMVELLQSLGHATFAGAVEQCMAGEHEKFTAWVRSYFTGEPLFKASNKQMCRLLYETMGLPVRVTNKPTKKMLARGIKVGNPKGDNLAMEYALRDANEQQKAVIEGLKLMAMVRTRQNLYYKKYPYFIHWMTGKIHSSHNQSATNTRRASSSKPNVQQFPKHPKIEGTKVKFRECVVPHHPDAVIVSLDFNAQELRVIADYSNDPNMVACYVGEHKMDMHSLTGHGILVAKEPEYRNMTYDEFVAAIERGEHDAEFKKSPLYKLVKKYRNLGKKVNFTTEYGAMAPKLAATMLVPESEAQMFIDKREAAFKVAAAWKKEVVMEAKRNGFVRTKMGAVRHLQKALQSDDPWIKSKAERQAVNFKIQSSCAEMTKRAEGRVWQMGLTYNYDAVCIGPIHDEIVFSVMKKDLFRFLKDAHWCMTQPYGGMFIPIESSISFGPNFGDQHEIGMVPSDEAIAEALAAIEKARAKEKVS